jgi:nucleoside-diphosphate-sugar epimerase
MQPDTTNMNALFHDHYRGKRTLITGGVGFIGSNLAARLVELGAQVTLVDSLMPQYGGNLHNIGAISEKVRVNISDIRDEHSFGAGSLP